MTISAKVIADSINVQGVRILTFELEYPRFIHSELMTHRVFSRNSASSRAIPVNSMITAVRNNPATPIHWGKNQAGMQAKEELPLVDRERVQRLWQAAMENATNIAQQMADLGAHKQIVNRITESYQHMKVLVTSTEWNNWYWLRLHPDAQPEIEELAKQMKAAADASTSESLHHGEWHIPYVSTLRDDEGFRHYYDDLGNRITPKEALMISCSACAQVSYRKSDTSLEKAEVIYKRLIESEPCHASPTEHQAICYEYGALDYEPYTHYDMSDMPWSNNFRTWVQHRAMIENNVKKG